MAVEFKLGYFVTLQMLWYAYLCSFLFVCRHLTFKVMVLAGRAFASLLRYDGFLVLTATVFL